LLEILALQVIAAILGTLSIGAADWLYSRRRMRQSLHALWVATSSTAICLPLLTWIIITFLGDGMISWVLVSTLCALMFLWMHRNLLKVPAVQTAISTEAAFRSSSRPVPPSSRINN